MSPKVATRCSTSSEAWKYASEIVLGFVNAAFRSRSFNVSPLFSIPANPTSIPRPHSGRWSVSSYTEMPSVNQRGTRWLDIWIVMTCASSCQSVASHWNSPGGRAFGESRVTTRPKQAPSAPIMPGRPTFLTAKSSCFGNISMRIGPFGVNAYRFRHRGERLPRERQHVILQHRRLGLVHAQHDVALGAS